MMSHQSRAELEGDRIGLPASGGELTFPRSGLTYFAPASATTTAAACPAYANLPPGLRFTLDNTNGSGSMTVTPVSGTAIVVTTGKVFDFYVSATGALKAGELAAHPQ
jgi:hypothetical protein